jgi:DNA (cytosine-5)-methyltransferase 1
VRTKNAVDVDQAFLRASERPSIEVIAGPTIRIVDLFCGCGGLSVGAIEGARRAGRPAEIQLAVDERPEPLEVMRRSLGFPTHLAAQLDLSQVLAGLAAADRKTEQHIKALGRGAHLLLAGPPCQGHSALNNHTRHDDARNDLYLAVARVARLLEPSVVVIENVRGVGTDRRNAVNRCAAALQELGYCVQTRLLNLHSLGAAQTRVRHVLVATRDQLFDFDSLHESPGRDVRWAIADLEPRSPSLFDIPSVPSLENAKRMQWLVQHPDIFNLPNDRRPACHQGDHSYRSMYGQLRWDLPAQTITSGYGSMGQGRFVHPAEARTLTPHEAARLQFLPDFMDFSSVRKRGHLATMIGNAAPPILTIAIAQSLIEQQLL